MEASAPNHPFSMQNFNQDFIMDGRVLCPSLPDLLRKTILTFCEGSVKFQRTLEVIGSIHICSDSEKIATFLLDEQVTRADVGADVHASDSVSKVAVNETFPPQDINTMNANQEKNNNNKSSNPGIMLPPKKSRKTLKPVRKVNYRYIQNLESSDAESDNEYITVDQNGRDQNGLQPGRDYIAARPLGMLEKRMREYLDNTDSNASISSEETYKQPPVITKQESEAQTSPSGPASYEVSSTRPDDAVSVDQGTNESPSLSPQDSTPKGESPNVQSPEETDRPNDSRVKQEMDTDGKYPYDSAYARSYESALILSTLATAHNAPLFGMMDPKAFVGKPEQAYAMFSNNNNIIDPSQKAIISNSSIFLPQQQEQVFAEDLRSRRYASPEPTTIFSGRGTPGMQGQKEMTEGSWDKPVLCKICGKALKSEKMLDIHMNTAHTHKTIYPCKQCGKVFYAASSLHSHKKRTHTSMEQKYKCPHCDRFYAFQSELLRHIDTAHMDLLSSSNASQVNIGSDVAAFWAAYREHPPMNMDVSPPPPLQPQQQSPPPPAPQPVTPAPPQPLPPPPPQQQQQQEQESSKMIQKHQNGLTTITVPGTNSPFTLLGQSEDAKPRASPTEDMKPEVVHNAMITDDQTAAVNSALGPRYKCTVCGMLLKSKECLSLHINAKHTQKQAYPCNVCGKVFYAPSSRFCHIRRVHASTEQKFHCDYCDKIFTFHYELRNHLKLMHRNKLIQRSDGNVSESDPSIGDGGDESCDIQDLSNGTASPTQEISVSKASTDQG